MLGDKVVDNERGKVVGIRVLPSEGNGPRVEITFQTTAKVLGLDVANTGTVTSVMAKARGGFYEEGQGLVMGTEGDAAMWIYKGIFMPTGPGMTSTHRGCVFFETASEKLARLNQVCAMVEANVDAEGNMSANLWEWK